MISPLTYVLHGRTVIAEPDREAWAVWLDTARERGDHLVAQANLSSGLTVSTVFTGIGYDSEQPELDGRLMVFETVVFAAGEPGRQQRYPTWEEAFEGHKAIVADIGS